MRVETRIKLDRFQLRPYQLPIADALENKGYRKIVAIMPRRAGKDFMAWQLLIRQALKRIAVYHYVFPTYAMAKKILWTSITNDSVRFLDMIPAELVDRKNEQEMKIHLINGSIIQLVGSDNADGLVGTNAYGVIFSEYALQDPLVYSLIYRPILTANGGWALFISCVNPETLIISQDGLTRIKNISSSREEYTNIHNKIYGLGGFHTAEQFYYGGMQKTLIITLESGYALECTPIHPIWNGESWIKSHDLKTGDLIPIQYGQNVWGSGIDFSGFINNEHGALRWRFNECIVDDDFFYLLGLIHADGNYDQNKVCVTKKKDQQIIDFLHLWNFKTRKDGIHHEFSSKEFCSLLEYLNFKHGARNKIFPSSLFSCTYEQMKSFIQGVFDGDGSSNSYPSKYGRLKLTSTSIDFIKDLQIVLLNFGIVSSIYQEDKAPTKRVKVWSRIYNLEISGYFAHVFYRDIGFRLERKQQNWKYVQESCYGESGNIVPIDISKLDGYFLPKSFVQNPSRISRRKIKELVKRKWHPYLQSILDEKLFYSPIKSIEESSSEVFDFVIPETHSFMSNGFISHNTPRGKNHLFEMYQIAQHNPQEWFAYKLTVEDTGHIPLWEIEKEKQDGLMSDDLIQQEYYCSFDLGVEGSYYGKYLDRMRVQNRITDVAWENSAKVHTAWDLGMRDSTTIIFFQTIGTSLRIIDTYENAGHGLDHYIKVLQQKPYSYGKHIAPHDIQVRELGTGMSRLEKARQLGISFIVAPNLSIEDGIEAVRSATAKMWIDIVNCKNLIKALENYRHEYDSKKKIYKNNPLHDFSSHFCFTGDTLIATEKGNIEIKDIQIGDSVKTPFGYRMVTNTHTRFVTELTDIHVGNTIITTTSGHNIFTQRNIVRSDSLRYTDIMEYDSFLSGYLWKKIYVYFGEELNLRGFKKNFLSLTMKPKSSLMVTFLDGMENIMFARKVNLKKYPIFIVMYGLITKALFQIGITFITLMETLKIMLLKILNVFQPKNILNCMQIAKAAGPNQIDVESFYCLKMQKQQNGIKVKKVKSGTENMPQSHYRCSKELNTRKHANAVLSNIQRSLYGKNSVLMRVKQRIGLYIKRISYTGLVVSAKLYSFVINTLLKKHVVKNVQSYQVIEPKQVYDLSVDIDNCYYANGYLVSNSDAMRYLCISLSKTRDGLSPEDLERRYQEAMIGPQGQLPRVFRDNNSQY